MSKINFEIIIPNESEVIKSLGMNNYGDTQLFLTHRAKVRMERHVPLRTGKLIRSAIEDYNTIIYSAITEIGFDYADVVYRGINFNFNEAPQRGAYWDQKMMIEQGKELENDIQKYLDDRRG